MRTWFTQLICGIFGGHDEMRKFEDERIFLACSNCGHESAGWSLNEVPPTPCTTR